MSNTALVFALSALKKANTANERIDNLPLPMVFKGTLGTGGTISTLPTASSSNEGFVYIVITDGTYAGQTAKAGDTFVSDGSSWVLIPAGDEPSVIDDSVTSTALTWSSKKISDKCEVKGFTYTGTGTTTSLIQFPTKPSFIFSIQGEAAPGNWTVCESIIYGLTQLIYTTSMTTVGSQSVGYIKGLSYDTDNNTMSMTASSAGGAMNTQGIEFTVYYI